MPAAPFASEDSDFLMRSVKSADKSSVMEPARDILRLAHHRSRQRIQSFGEVWTPKKHVRQMLDMLDKSVWTDIGAVFFEPACGHGNFVEAVVQRRLNAILNKAKRQKIKRPHFYAAANTLNTLWAIDIDLENIKFCRDRVWSSVFKFLWSNERRRPPKAALSLKSFIRKHKDFLAHVLCCIEWQIQENEALSCLESDPQKARLAAEKTAVSRQWIKKNKHRPIDFKKTWLWRFEALKKSKIVPLEYKKNSKKLDSLLQDKKQPVFKKNQPLNLLTFLHENKKETGRLSRHKKPHVSDSFMKAA